MSKKKYKTLSPLDDNALRLLDPERLYRYKWESQVKASSRGVEYLLYKLIPYSYIRSITVAIDPFYKYRVNPLKVVVPNRIRYRGRTSVLDQRSADNYRHVYSFATYKGSYYGVPISNYDDPVWNFNMPDQATLKWDFHDTVMSSRPLGQPLGGKESYSFTVRSPSRIIRATERIDSYDAGFGNGYRSYHFYNLKRVDVGPAARIDPVVVAQLRIEAFTKANEWINEHTTGMLKVLSPSRREYTLFRNLVELRDLPRSIRNLRNTMRHLKEFYKQLTPDQISRLWLGVPALVKDVPKEYLGFVFGWKLMYNDTLGLVSAPTKIAKRIAYLQRRGGKDTTFRIRKKLQPYTAPISPSFQYDWTGGEKSPSQSSKHVMDAELRLVINAVFDFPPVGTPEFQSDLFLRKLGAVPTFTDLYNLVPWTWLIDWATGLGNYLDTIEAINSDGNLINWGVITCDIRGKMTTLRRWKENHYDTLLVQTQPAVTSHRFPEFRHQSEFEYKYSVRKGLADIGVNTLENTSSLTTYQQSILGAILLSRK